MGLEQTSSQSHSQLVPFLLGGSGYKTSLSWADSLVVHGCIFIYSLTREAQDSCREEE